MLDDIDQYHKNDDDGDDAHNCGQIVIWEICIGKDYYEDNDKFICLSP